MKISDVLKSNRQILATCVAEESIPTVSERLSQFNIGALPVCGANKQLVGVLSERDIVRGFAKDGAKLSERRVRDLMTRNVITCAPDDNMQAAEDLMNKHRVRHLPVVEGSTLIGMLSIRDVIVWRLEESRNEANVLRDAVIAARHR